MDRTAEVIREAKRLPSYVVGIVSIFLKWLSRMAAALVLMAMINWQLAHSDTHRSAVDSAASAAGKAQAVGLTGGGLSVVGGFASSDVAAYGGLLIGAIGLAVQWYYRRKEFKLKEAELNAKLAERGFYEQG